jgi:hypothetical protein
MRDGDVWHSPYPPVDRSPGLLHQEVIGRARGWPGRPALTDAATGAAPSQGLGELEVWRV